jgi:hypothetical protein
MKANKQPMKNLKMDDKNLKKILLRGWRGVIKITDNEEEEDRTRQDY